MLPTMPPSTFYLFYEGLSNRRNVQAHTYDGAMLPYTYKKGHQSIPLRVLQVAFCPQFEVVTQKILCSENP